MAITCRELLQDEYFKDKVSILAGRSGINNSIMWFYIAGDADRSGAMPGGGELLFVQKSFTETSIIKQIDYIDSCLRRHVPGMVVIGGVESNERTGLMLNYADETGFPVFTVDNPMEMVGITKRLASVLIHDEDETERVRSFMRDLVSDDEMPFSLVLRRGFSCDINLRSPFFFVSLGCNYGSAADDELLGNIIRFRDNLDYIFSELERICSAHSVKLLTYGSEWQAICLIGLDPADPMEQYSSITAEIDEFLKEYSSGSGLRVTAGYSELGRNAERIKIHCRQSERALEFVSKGELHRVSIAFNELGVMRFVGYLSEKEKCELIEHARSELRPLIETDQNNGTEYVRTYRVYLTGKGTLQEAADMLYIHRNTLLKRLEQIEHLLGKDIHDPVVKNEGMNVFFVLDYFGINCEHREQMPADRNR